MGPRTLDALLELREAQAEVADRRVECLRFAALSDRLEGREVGPNLEAQRANDQDRITTELAQAEERLLKLALVDGAAAGDEPRPSGSEDAG